MKKRAGYIRARLPEQSGQALILVIVFLLLGSLTLVPLLSQINTALKSGVKYEEKTYDLYAADAGIEDGIWRIKYGGLQALFGTANYDYDFSTNGSYNLDKTVNGETTNVTIQNIWIPSNETLSGVGLSPDEARTMIDSQKLVTSGTAGAVVGQPYRIKLEFTPAADDNLTIKSVGVWLPQGFSYAGGGTLEALGHPYTTVPSDLPYCGGRAVIWSYTAPYPLFTSFPNFVSENGTMTSTIYFNYTPPATDPFKMPSGIAWVTTEMHNALGSVKADLTAPENVPISWDTNTRIYKITSIAGGTKVEAYTSKLELSLMGDAAAGDYVAVGNSLMNTAVSHAYTNLLSSSSATVSTVPSNGDALDAYLYWSGWRNNAVDIFSDECYSFYEWSRSLESTHVRVPVSDNDTSGTWDTAPCWDDVDETTYNDSDYITGAATSGGSAYKLFNFSPFTVTAGTPITDLSIYMRAKDASSGGNNIRQSIKVNGTRYNTTSTSRNPDTTYILYSYSYTTNPDTSAAWTVDDINGTGTHPLQQFGVYSGDLDPDMRVSMIYATATDSRWTISSDKFQGRGSATATTAQRTLTMKNSIDLLAYTPGTVVVSWEQSKSGTLESDDALYYAISADGGATWSGDYEVFHGNSPRGYGSFVVPATCMTSAFKFRFYTNFNDTGEYVSLDDIAVQNITPDTSITFSIAGQQVSLDANGDPQLGGALTADTFSVLKNATGYSYACKADVSNLVKKYPIVAGETHHSGNAQYTVGSVTADTGNEISYAGWSIVIVYFSPETAGHYLYLRDVFSYTFGGEDLDFDGDGTPGGDIDGFVIPEPIKNKDGQVIETIAAKLTCFVGEGDSWYAGDYVALNAPDGLRTNPTDYINYESYKLWDNITLTTPTPVNNAAHPNNVWNSQSAGMSEPGMDIDTFEITWASQLLKPGDTKLHLDMYTQTDQWNIVYFIISIRSKTTVGGTGHYIISSN